jgi:hypothetical protein
VRAGFFNSAETPGAAPPSMAANPTLKAKARMPAPARAAVAVCINVLQTSFGRRQNYDTRPDFTARLLILI